MMPSPHGPSAFVSSPSLSRTTHPLLRRPHSQHVPGPQSHPARRTAVRMVSSTARSSSAQTSLHSLFLSRAAGPRRGSTALERAARAEDGSLRAFLKEVTAVRLLSEREVGECAGAVRVLLRWEEVRAKLLAGRKDSEREWYETVRQLEGKRWRDAMQKRAKGNGASAAPTHLFAELGLGGAEGATEEWAKVDFEKAFTFEVFQKCLQRVRAAKERLVAGNLRLVVTIARRYACSGVSLSDLIQEGSLGLIRGAERFDSSKGFRFATYASWWIRQSIQQAITERSRMIRLPHMLDLTAKKVAEVRARVWREEGKRPSEEEVASLVGVSRERLAYVSNKVAETSTVSLDIPLYGDEERRVTLGDALEDPASSPEEVLTRDLLRDDLEGVMLSLNPMEREVVRRKYGFDDGLTKSYEDLAKTFRVTASAIRQIENRALRKLRNPRWNAVLKDYITNL